jgi:hypothetical protein
MSLYRKIEAAWVSALTLLLVYLGWMVFSSPFSHADFNLRDWALAAHDGTHCTRGEMVDSLLRKHVKPGMEKTELVALLGKPDKEFGDESSYDLGACQIFSDMDSLDFYFDRQGTLIRHVIDGH